MSHLDLEVSRGGVSRAPDREGKIDTITPLVVGGGSSDYSNSGAPNLNSNTELEFYNVVSVGGFGATVTANASGWVSSVTLPPGTYLITALVAVKFTASGVLRYYLHESGVGGRGPVIGLGDTAPCQTSGGGVMVAIVAPTSSTTYSIRINNRTNAHSVAGQGATPSQSYLIIETLL